MFTNLLVLVSTLLISTTAFAEFKGLVCLGTEPFWSLKIDALKGRMGFSAPGAKAATYAVTKPLNAHGVQEMMVMVFKGLKSDVSATVISSSLAGKCTDGMSDAEYSYHVVYTNRKAVQYGCCELMAQD